VHLDGVRRGHEALGSASAEEYVLDGRFVHVENRATAVADEMLVMIALTRQFEMGMTCAERKLADEAGGGEAGEGAIDRGAGDRGAAGAEGEPYVVGAEMVGSRGEGFEDEDALRRRAKALGAEGRSEG
jgi:hypothetical protein